MTNRIDSRSKECCSLSRVKVLKSKSGVRHPWTLLALVRNIQLWQKVCIQKWWLLNRLARMLPTRSLAGIDAMQGCSSIVFTRSKCPLRQVKLASLANSKVWQEGKCWLLVRPDNFQRQACYWLQCAKRLCGTFSACRTPSFVQCDDVYGAETWPWQFMADQWLKPMCLRMQWRQDHDGACQWGGEMVPLGSLKLYIDSWW